MRPWWAVGYVTGDRFRAGKGMVVVRGIWSDREGNAVSAMSSEETEQRGGTLM